MGYIDGVLDFFREDFEAKHAIYFFVIMIIFGVALWVRYLPADNMEYIQALDPYMITRMSASIAESGSLPAVDVLRYFPYFNPTYMINEGTVVIPALMFQVARRFGMDFLTWAQFYPAFMGALAIFPIYFVGKEMFDRKAGVLAAFFLATSVAVMHRSSAGWFGKEPPAMFLMITSIYFFFKAWEEDKWWPGIVAGVVAGISGTAWGGTRFLYMLYPVTVLGFVAGLPIVASVIVNIFGKKMKKLDVGRVFKAYTPFALLGTTLTVILDGSSNTMTFPNTYFYFHIGVLAFLTIRYAVEKYDLVSEDNLPYVPHILVFLGGLALILSPVYSQTVASTTSSIISRALQDSTGVIGGTVAENTPSTVNEVVVQLGASMSAERYPAIGMFADYFSGWTFGVIGLGIITVLFCSLFYKHYFESDKIKRNIVSGGVSVAVPLLAILIHRGLAGGGVSGFFPAIILTTLTTSLVFLYNSFTSEKGLEQWIIILYLIGFVTLGFSVFIGELYLAAGIGALNGVAIMLQKGEDMEIEFSWSYIIVVVWMVSTIYGATQRSRLFILTGAPTALVAGLGLSKSIDYVKTCNFWDRFSGDVFFKLCLAVGAIFLIVFNVTAVHVRSEQIGGSPEEPWYDAFEFMREETPEGSVMLSWWDYGYWTQSIGERPTIADGGNHRHYTNENVTERVNYPIAEFLSSENPENHTDWLEKYGTDYIFLDSTMIGKFSAVSQIARRSNEDFHRMEEVNCAFDQTTGSCQVSEVGDNTVIHYQLEEGLELLLPVDMTGDGVEVGSAPVITGGGHEIQVNNVCSEDGLQEFGEGGSTGGFQEAIRESLTHGRDFGGCVSIHPYYGPQRLVMVPPAVMDSTLVRLYLMDGEDIDFVDKVFDNGYVKMWEVEG